MLRAAASLPTAPHRACVCALALLLLLGVGCGTPEPRSGAVRAREQREAMQEHVLRLRRELPRPERWDAPPGTPKLDPAQFGVRRRVLKRSRDDLYVSPAELETRERGETPAREDDAASSTREDEFP